MKGDPLWLTKPKQVSSPVHPFVVGGSLNTTYFIGLYYSTQLVVCNLKPESRTIKTCLLGLKLVYNVCVKVWNPQNLNINLKLKP